MRHTPGQLEAGGTDLGDGSGCGSFLQTEEERVSSPMAPLGSLRSTQALTSVKQRKRELADTPSGSPMAPLGSLRSTQALTPVMPIGWVVCYRTQCKEWSS